MNGLPDPKNIARLHHGNLECTGWERIRQFFSSRSSFRRYVARRLIRHHKIKTLEPDLLSFSLQGDGTIYAITSMDGDTRVRARDAS